MVKLKNRYIFNKLQMLNSIVKTNVRLITFTPTHTHDTDITINKIVG